MTGLSGCLSGESPENTISEDAVGNAFSSGINSLSQAMQSSTAGLPGSNLAALRRIKKSRFSLIGSAYAVLGVGGCSDSDPDVTLTVVCSDTDHTATILRDFGAGCNVGDDIIVTGKEYIGWTNMGSPACGEGNTRPNFWTAVQGASAKQLLSTDPNSPTSPVEAVTRTFSNGSFLKVVGRIIADYSNYQSSGNTQTVEGSVTLPGTSRIKYQSDGVTKIYDHTISTVTPLSIHLENTSGQAPIRTVVSGEVAVSHNLAEFTVHNTPQNIKYDYNQCECHPVSGVLLLSVTDNNTQEEIGSGSVTFTAEQTGTCDTIDVNYQGRSIRIPTLERCR